MKQVPLGTVTFLFTDIEGSTKLWEEHRDVMNEVLAQHDLLMRTAINANNGYLVKVTGDGHLAAFDSALDAVSAAIEAQLALHREDWGQTPIRVRMSIHTGEATARDGDYYGPTLNRAARLMAIGFGGQVLLSEATQRLLADNMPAGLNVKDLGQHRLKDLAEPERVYQLVHSDLLLNFPPLKSLSSCPNNLPAQVNSFIGRERDLTEVMKLLETSRLVTLTGVAGTGKTRLSIQIAAELIERYDDGVWLVELARLSDPAWIAKAIGEVLRVPDVLNEMPLETLTNWLRRKNVMLVLDNCEHLVDAVAMLCNDLLRNCPALHILATSREALDIAGEHVHVVSPLPLPSDDVNESPGTLMQAASVQLFVERAISVKNSFRLTEQNAEAVSFICRRLDGIPLALELAAARLQMMTSQKLAEMLEDRFRLLTGGRRTALPHQQTLRATITWSYDLLTEPQRLLLNRLSVFRGGYTLEAADGVCAGGELNQEDVLDHLSELVQKSLVELDETGEEVRYRLLETVRQYADEKIEEMGERDRISEAHLAYFVNFSSVAQPGLNSSEQPRWIERLDQDHDNLRLAISYALSRNNVEAAQQICSAIGRYWLVRGHYAEGVEWVKLALRERPQATRKAQAGASRWAGWLHFQQGDYERARDCFEQALAIGREMNDKEEISHALNGLGSMKVAQGQCNEARRPLEDSLALSRELVDTRGISNALNNLGNVAMGLGNYEEARILAEQALDVARDRGDRHNIANTLGNLGYIAVLQNQVDKARVYLKESLYVSREVGATMNLIYEFSCYAWIFQLKGNYEIAAQLQGICARLLHEIGGDMEDFEESIYDLVHQALVKAIGDVAYQRAFERGKLLSLDQAASLAISE